MVAMKSNKIVPAIAVGAVGFVALVAVAVTGNDGPPSVPAGAPMTSLPAPALPDEDTASDTLKNVQAELTAERAERQRLEGTLEETRTETKAAVKTTEDRLRDEFERRLKEQNAKAKRAADERDEVLFGRITDAISSTFASDRLDQAAAPDRPEPSSALPLGGGAIIGGNDGIVGVPDQLPDDAIDASDFIWLDPLDQTSLLTEDGAALLPASFNAQQALTSAQSAVAQAPDLVDGALGGEEARPFYTIPNLSTLTSSTAFTALIGRVPVAGQVRDPVRFRALVGRENLAASGIRAPADIVGMVFEGSAIGDWTLGCVEGVLHAATFVFEDGTIRTVFAGMDDNREQGEGGNGTGGVMGLGGKGGQNRAALGYIADRYGIPCVAGERVTNARNYLAGRVALTTAQAAAQAAAAAETVQVVGVGQGVVGSAVTGDRGEYVLGSAAAGGLAEVNQYLRDRAADQFDVVFVEPGREIALLITEEISIDYDPQGRRTEHASFPSSFSRPTLD